MNSVIFDMEWNQPLTGCRKVVRNVLLSGEIIQIGAVMLDGDLNEIGSFDVRVAPQVYTELNPSVAEVTGITQEIMESGEPFPEAVGAFLQWCGTDVRLFSWGPDDAGVLLQNFALHSLNNTALPPVYDLQKLFGLQTPGVPQQCGLLRALEYLQEPALTAHDALNDAANTVAVMRRMKLCEEALPRCLVGSDPETQARYLLNHDFSTAYRNFRDVLCDRNVNVFVSPMSGQKVACPGWRSLDTGVLATIASDRDGFEYFVQLQVRRRKSGGYRASRRVWLSSEHFRSLYALAAG